MSARQWEPVHHRHATRARRRDRAGTHDTGGEGIGGVAKPASPVDSARLVTCSPFKQSTATSALSRDPVVVSQLRSNRKLLLTVSSVGARAPVTAGKSCGHGYG